MRDMTHLGEPQSAAGIPLLFLGVGLINLAANRQRIASSRSSFFRHRIVYLQVGRSRHFIRQKCRFSVQPASLGSGPSLPFAVLRRAWVVCLEEEPGYSGSPGGGDDRS